MVNNVFACCFIVHVSGCTRVSYIFTSELSASDETTTDKDYSPLGFDASCSMCCTCWWVAEDAVV